MTALYHWFATCGVNSVCWDLTKLILQLLGAVCIAWLTVWLALRRFKSDKGWERQISTLTDLLIAIDEMHRIAGADYDGADVHVTIVEVPAFRGIWIATAGKFGHRALKRATRP